MAAVAASAVGHLKSGAESANVGGGTSPLHAATIQAAVRAMGDKVRAEQALIAKGAKLLHVRHLASLVLNASPVHFSSSSICNATNSEDVNL